MAVIAISGGGQGIGRAIAWHFASLGYAVSITDLDAEAGRESLEHMQAMGARALFLKGRAIVSIASARALMSEPDTEGL